MHEWKKKLVCDTTQILYLNTGTSSKYKERFSVTGPVTDRTLLTGEIRGCSQEESNKAHRKEGSSKASQEGRCKEGSSKASKESRCKEGSSKAPQESCKEGSSKAS